MAKTQDPIFAEYARTAPLEDLRAYLRYAERRLAQYELPDRTVALIGEMFTLERELVPEPGTPASRKRRVWELIARFKSSIPGFAGACGAKGSWIEEDTVYRRLVKKARGPVSAERLRVACERASAPMDAKQLFRIPLRAVPLAVDQVQALIVSVTPASTTAPAAQKPKPPSWRQRAIDAEAALREAQRRIASLNGIKPRAVKAGTRKPVDWSAAGRKAAETRRRNLAAKSGQAA